MVARRRGRARRRPGPSRAPSPSPGSSPTASIARSRIRAPRPRSRSLVRIPFVATGVTSSFPAPVSINYLYEINAAFRSGVGGTSAALVLLSSTGFADEGPLDPAPPKGITTEEIIQRFAAKETQFQQARDQYTYRQDVMVKTPEDDGEYHEIFDVLFNDQGKRLENVVFAPQSSLVRIQMSPEDWTISVTVCPSFLPPRRFRNIRFSTSANSRKTSCTATSSTSHPRKSSERNDIFRAASGSMTAIFRS